MAPRQTMSFTPDRVDSPAILSVIHAERRYSRTLRLQARQDRKNGTIFFILLAALLLLVGIGIAKHSMARKQPAPLSKASTLVSPEN